MATKTAILAVKVVTDATDAKKGLDDVAKSTTGFSDTMGKMAVPAGIAVAAIGALAKASYDAASALQQNVGAVEAVFGAYADQVKGFAKDAADNVGLATSQYDQLAAVLGAQLKNLGTPMEEVAGQTNDLIGLGADLAAQFGGNTADAVDALSSLLRGERDPIERYGVSIKQATIDAKKAEMGLGDLTGAADAHADSVATMALLYQQTGDAQGTFARESDTAAGATQRATAKWENAQAALGEALLPVMTKAAEVASKLATAIAENPQAFQDIIVVFGILAGTIIAITAAQWLWNLAMAANPIGLVVLAIGAIIALIVLLVLHWDVVAKAAADAWGTVIKWIQDAGGWFQSVFDDIGQWWDGLMKSFQNGFDDLFGWINDALGWFGSLGNASASSGGGGRSISASPSLYHAVPGASHMGSLGAASGRSIPAGGSTIININGAIDPDGTAQQIRRILRQDNRRIGFIAAAGGRN